MTFVFTACSDGIVSECTTCGTGNATVKATFSSIQSELFDKTCAAAGCHSGNFPQAGLLLSGNAYDRIVNVGSSEGMNYITPGNSSQSLIYKRITSNGGSIMPPTGKLPQSVIDSVKAWIDAGALNN